ncbi:unnamed protein product [Pylaiella littoralis]
MKVSVGGRLALQCGLMATVAQAFTLGSSSRARTTQYHQHGRDHEPGHRPSATPAAAPCVSCGALGPSRRRRTASRAAPLVVVSAATGTGRGDGDGDGGGGGASADREKGASDKKGRTQRIMEAMPSSKQATGAGGSSTYQGLLRADAGWTALRNMKTGKDAGPAPTYVTESDTPLGTPPAYDVLVCGGTLGIFVATALQMRGFRVGVVERGPLLGREQEWNISEAELEEMVEAKVLSKEDAEECVSIRFNPLRAGFKRAEGDPDAVDTFCPDVLNTGVKPSLLVDRARRRFEAKGGIVMEFTSIDGVSVRPDGVALSTSPSSPPPGVKAPAAKDGAAKEQQVTSRLVLDCMGNASPMVRQIRWGKKPEGVCLVVGSCARGYDADTNKSGDIIYANTPILDKGDGVGVQYFWEAFPAGSGPSDRTTYMFAYMDADPRRTSLESMMDDYWDLLPKYQGVEVDDLEFQRVLFGFFPTYKRSPLPAEWDRVCQIGDASGMQSPLSFGGFACLTRHVKRISEALSEALEGDLLDKKSLGLVNAYQPSLTSTWMFQKSMSVGVGERVNPNLIVDLLSNNFKSMDKLGNPVLKPFLQDVVQFSPLLRVLFGVTTDAPLSIPPLVLHVGVLPLVDWIGHFLRMGVYSALHRVVGPTLRKRLSTMSKEDRYRTSRLLDAWEYGSGSDYRYEGPEA